MFLNKNKLILMHQTHSNKVLEIKKNNYKRRINSDAIISQEKGLLLGVVTADCVPILLYERIIIDVFMRDGKELFLELLKKIY